MVSNDKLRLKTGHRKYLIGLPCLCFRKTTDNAKTNMVLRPLKFCVDSMLIHDRCSPNAHLFYILVHHLGQAGVFR